MNKKLAIALLLAFAVMISLPWLVPHTGILALVAFVPLLCLDYIASGSGKKHFFWWYYGAFVLWNAFTTFWVWNATAGGCVAAILLNALQMAVIWALFRLSKKKFAGVLPYVFLAVMWMAWERSYFSAEISWPWLVLGNAFARSTSLAQWYDITGLMGGSLWIWLCNLGVFGLVIAVTSGRWAQMARKSRIWAACALATVFLVPMIASEARYASYQEVSEGTLDVVIGQPNFDPYHKFELMSQKQQTDFLLAQFDSAAVQTPALYLAPETFTSDIWLNEPDASPSVQAFREFLSRRDGSSMLFGASTYKYYKQASRPSPLAWKTGDGWYENRNSAVLLASEDSRLQFYHKSKLVVGTELTPYPEIFVPIDDKLGGVMGRCIGQEKPSLLYVNDSIPVGCAVCYESVYPEHCADYVNLGSRLIAVITNDAWWGDTPGYVQHLSYSCLRAIEERRDVVRSANTGISALIDQKGDIVEQTPWWQSEVLPVKANLSTKITPYVKYGDILGKVATFAFLLLAAWLLVCFVTRKGLGDSPRDL